MSPQRDDATGFWVLSKDILQCTTCLSALATQMYTRVIIEILSALSENQRLYIL
jgi:hypothetical protein